MTPETKATTTNPKDLHGEKKVSLTKLPAVAMLHGAHAMMHGAEKYGSYNWRAKDVLAHIYVDACMRHLLSWFEGQEIAEDSGVHHLGHALACCAILLDAQECGNLIDDRPLADDGGKGQGVAVSVLDRLASQIAARKSGIRPEITPKVPYKLCAKCKTTWSGGGSPVYCPVCETPLASPLDIAIQPGKEGAF